MKGMTDKRSQSTPGTKFGLEIRSKSFHSNAFPITLCFIYTVL